MRRAPRPISKRGCAVESPPIGRGRRGSAMSDDEVLDRGDEVPDDEELGGGEPGGGPGTLGFVAGAGVGARGGGGGGPLGGAGRGGGARPRPQRVGRRGGGGTTERVGGWRGDVESEVG